MYAVIEDSGTQIKVAEGDVVKVAKRELSTETADLTFDRVLYVGHEDGEPVIGQPLVAGASVSAEVLEEGREDKIEVIKFKRRKGYTRRRGHRQDYIKVRITGITAG
ncbi:MAG: 50S ribosomal protein L21 [Planctomycetota bacterium]